METVEIKSFDELIKVLKQDHFCCGHVVYRGVKDQVNHKLIPSVGRIADYLNSSLEDLISHENEILTLFRHRAYGELTKIPMNDWVWLALASVPAGSSPRDPAYLYKALNNAGSLAQTPLGLSGTQSKILFI